MRHWARFGDALREAGIEPNKLNAAYSESYLARCIVELAKELGHFPTHGDLRVKRSREPTFPTVFDRYRKDKLTGLATAFCAANPGFEDVAAMCVVEPRRSELEAKPDKSNDGFVYLIKSGRFYKIGKTNSVGRRERELAIQLPEQARTVHSIKTDDPEGIEAYWHRRFEAKRKNGEWFELSTQQVAAFRRRKFM